MPGADPTATRGIDRVVTERELAAVEVAVAAEITPEVAGEVVSEIAEGYPMVDPLMVEEIVKKIA